MHTYSARTLFLKPFGGFHSLFLTKPPHLAVFALKPVLRLFLLPPPMLLFLHVSLRPIGPTRTINVRKPIMIPASASQMIASQDNVFGT